jgi:hypothetical protein
MTTTYTPPSITDITHLIPKRNGRWRTQSAVYIMAIIVLHRTTAELAAAGDAEALKKLRQAISKGYPFDQRSGFAYQAWLAEVKEQIAALTGGKRPTTAEDIKYRLVGGKPK